MATDPRPRRSRRRASRRRARRSPCRSRWQQTKRPLIHLVVAVGCIPVALLLATGRPLLATLLLAGAAAAAALEIRLQYLQLQRRQQAEQDAKAVLELVYEDWIRAEAEQGHRDLERWRRTRRP